MKSARRPFVGLPLLHASRDQTGHKSLCLIRSLPSNVAINWMPANRCP